VKTSAYLRCVAVAAIALTPFAAQADDAVMDACVKTFVAQNFPGQSPTIRIERTHRYPLPLVLQTSAPRVKLVASDVNTDRVLATATCGEKRGIVTVEPAKPALIAAL
jgi:hypothetical protein